METSLPVFVTSIRRLPPIGSSNASPFDWWNGTLANGAVWRGQALVRGEKFLGVQLTLWAEDESPVSAQTIFDPHSDFDLKAMFVALYDEARQKTDE